MVEWQHSLLRDNRVYLSGHGYFKARCSVVVTMRSIQFVCIAKGDSRVYGKRLQCLASPVVRWGTEQLRV